MISAEVKFESGTLLIRLDAKAAKDKKDLAKLSAWALEQGRQETCHVLVELHVTGFPLENFGDGKSQMDTILLID